MVSPLTYAYVRTCDSCFWPATGTCLNDIPRNVCEDKSYEGGGVCRDGSCKDHEGVYGACLRYGHLSVYCTCEDAWAEECSDGEFLGESVNCHDLAFMDCANPDDEPCTPDDLHHFQVLCYRDCIATFAPVISQLKQDCLDTHQPHSPELCDCLYNTDVLECTFKLGCLRRFDGQYGTNGASQGFRECMDAILLCPHALPDRGESRASGGDPYTDLCTSFGDGWGCCVSEGGRCKCMASASECTLSLIHI